MRLAVWTLLNGSFGRCFVLLALVCTSFAAINQGTAKRTPTTPWGNTCLPHVQDSLNVGSFLTKQLLRKQVLYKGLYINMISSGWKYAMLKNNITLHVGDMFEYDVDD